MRLGFNIIKAVCWRGETSCILWTAWGPKRTKSPSPSMMINGTCSMMEFLLSHMNITKLICSNFCKSICCKYIINFFRLKLLIFWSLMRKLVSRQYFQKFYFIKHCIYLIRKNFYARLMKVLVTFIGVYNCFLDVLKRSGYILYCTFLFLNFKMKKQKMEQAVPTQLKIQDLKIRNFWLM